MERVAPSRVRYLSVVAVLLIWAQGVYFSLADQAFAQDITTSLPRFALFVTGHGLVIAAVIGSVVFGIAHLYQGVDSAIATGLQAVLFVLIYLRKRKALEVVTAHAVYDIIGITIAYWIY